MTKKADPSEAGQKRLIQEAYGKIAEGGQASCCGAPPDREQACGSGYSQGDVESLPEGAFLGLSCGNPIEEARLEAGEVVLDLGSGGGHDALLAARRVGPSGRVVGVDMTPQMVERARGLAEEMGFVWVEFRMGEIEALPVEDASVDVVLSNCVINLSPDKPQVFREVARVLKPGGRMVISDIVLGGEIPEAVRSSAAGLVACLAGAVGLEDYLGFIRRAGLEIGLVTARGLPLVLAPETTDPLIRHLYEAFPGAESLVSLAESVTIEATKPL